MIGSPVLGIADAGALGLIAVGLALGVLVAFVLVSRSDVRPRRLWISFAVLVFATFVVWDAIELRFEDRTGPFAIETDAFYYRSEWDWESGGGGLTEWLAAAALYAVPSVAAALAYSAFVLATPPASRRAVCVLAAPLGLLLALGLYIAIYGHPYLLWPSRTSLAGVSAI